MSSEGVVQSLNQLSLEELIQVLNLERLEPEGGYFNRKYVIEEKFHCQRLKRERPMVTMIDYLMCENSASAWHRLDSEELWQFVAGDRAEMQLYFPDGKRETVAVGAPNREACQSCKVVPRGVYQSTKIKEVEVGWSLFTCTVSPGFEWEECEFPSKEFLKVLCEELEDCKS